MRTRTFIVLQLLACAYICSGQNKKTFGTDPASIICFKEVRINAGYAFGRKWSANADISINMENTSERWDEREAAHWLELYGKEQDSRDFKDDFIESCISFCYWPQSPFAGPVLTIGACVRDRSGPDMTVGAGYSCRIWKGLYAGFAYRIRVIESISKQHTPIEGIRISLDYVF
jgi:hypothetical protein